jgi:hypothetical protein
MQTEIGVGPNDGCIMQVAVGTSLFAYECVYGSDVCCEEKDMSRIESIHQRTRCTLWDHSQQQSWLQTTL